MTEDRTEQLIREVFADEADRAADPRQVLARVRSGKPRRTSGLVAAAAAPVVVVVVVVAAVAAFVVSTAFERGTTSVGGDGRTLGVAPTDILVMGTDKAGWTDSVVLTQVAADGAVNVVSIPRDTWVSAPGGMGRLNQVYAKGGVEALLTTIRDLTGVTVDHYVVIDMTVFGELVDAVGGVEVCLKNAVSDPLAGANFPEGNQVISGEEALAFVRQRRDLPNGDIDRVVRLQAFLGSLAPKLRDADLEKLVTAVQSAAARGRVEVDPGLDLLGLAMDLAGAKAVRVGTIPFVDADFVTPEGGPAIQVDPATVKKFVTELPSTSPTTGVPCVN